MVQVSKPSFLGGLCSDRNTFSRAAGARRARSENFPRIYQFYAKTVPTSYRTSKSVHRHPKLAPQNAYYYIDLGNLCPKNFFLVAQSTYKIPRGIFWGNFTQLCDFSELVFKQRAALKSLGTTDLKSWFFYAHLIINDRHFRSEQFMKVILI